MKMMMRALVASTMLTVALPAAAQVVIEGNYIRAGVSSSGTFGSNGNADPGLIHDPTGTGTFNSNLDYIAPGIPHDGFSFNSTQTGFIQNDNAISSQALATTVATALLTGAAAEGYQNAAAWTGANAFLRVTNSYFFNDGDERILVRTVITALQGLTNLAFARSVDPDSDSRAFGTASSNNQRGNSLFGINDFIGSAGAVSGRTLAIVNLSGDTYRHTTQINSDCCDNIDPYNVLANTGGDLGLSSTGDHGLNMAWSIGDLTAGQVRTINYAYAVGARIADTGAPTGGVPEPSTWAMMIAGFGLVGGAMRRRSTKVAFA